MPQPLLPIVVSSVLVKEKVKGQVQFNYVSKVLTKLQMNYLELEKYLFFGCLVYKVTPKLSCA